MKLVWVVPGGVDRTGVERVIPCLLWQIERLASRHELHVVALRQEPEPCRYELLGATVHNLGGRSAVARRPALRAAAAAIGGGIDAVHAWWAGEPSAVARRLAQAGSGRYVLTLAGGEVTSLPDIGYGGARDPVRRWRLRRELRAATALTCLTEYLAGRAARFGAHPQVVPVGIDWDRFASSAERPDGPPWRLLHVASLSPVKDQETLLRGFAALVERGCEAQLEIVGVDTLDGRIQRLARELGVADRVRFAGWQPIDEVAAAYRRSHLLLHTSRHESGPLVVLEAAAAGLATVGTRVGQVADWAPERAWAVEVRDAPGLADALEEALADPDRRRAVAEAARDWTRAHDADWTADQFDGLYRSLSG